MKADKEFKDLEKLLDDMETVIGKQLTASQKVLVEKLSDAISGQSTKGSIPRGTNLSRVIEKGYAEFKQEELPKVMSVLVKHLVSILDAGQAYFSVIAGKDVGDSEKYRVLKSLGIEATQKTFKVISGGYLESLVYDADILNDIKRVTINAAFGDVELTALNKQMRDIIEGTNGTEGKFERHFKTYTYDVLQRTSRYQTTAIAEKVGLKAFIYSGTVIDNTRKFCKDRAGKVFTIEEAQEWENEDFAGKPKDYDPLRDLGGHNCRHNKRYITAAEAIRRRPELANYFN